MFRLVLGVFSVLPWWAYAVLCVVLGNAALGLWGSHTERMAAAERLIREGPPPVQKLDDLQGVVVRSAFSELLVAGFVRADLGIGRLEGTVPKTYIVLDGTNAAGPLLAVMFVGSDDQDGLADLIATADDTGLVLANGFRRTLDWAEVSGQLRLKGVRREVLLMEAIVGDRAAALRSKGNSDLPFVVVVAGLAVLSGLIALRRRAQARKGGRPVARPASSGRPMPSPPPVETQPEPRPRDIAAPWGRTPHDKSQRHEPAGSPVETQAARIPEFKSVFPGNGSGFRFKTADEIIRETFGTVTSLDRPKSPD